MDELERMAQQAETEEKARDAEAAESEANEAKPEPEKLVPMEAAENRAQSILKIAEGACQMFIDGRLVLEQEEEELGINSLAPAIQKYELAGTGTGRIPYQEEVTAGFYIGGLIRRIIKAVKALRQHDREEENKREEAHRNGAQREHQTSQQSQPVSSEVGIWQNTDVAPAIRN
ncbi:hypothetical protein [Microbulbifer sp. PSTR4-B]|uniref:hypothetical protein n=1 Tax=Microbulbifer sp. PSTR4-B TaxID=3243396 RepID=UPI0040399E77